MQHLSPALQQRVQRVLARAQDADDISVKVFLRQQRAQLEALLLGLDEAEEARAARAEEVAAFIAAYEIRYEVIRWSALITREPGQVARIALWLLRIPTFVRELYQSSDTVTLAVCRGLTKRQAVLAVGSCPWLIHRLERVELSRDIDVVYAAVVGDPARGIWHVATMCEVCGRSSSVLSR